MSANERVKGIQIHRPIIYGSHSRLMTPEERTKAPADHTHKWTLFLTSAATPPPAKSATSSTDPPPIDMDYLPGGADDLSYLIKKVTFKLHETYTQPNRIVDHPPFQITETGWGEFVVNIRIQFVPESGEKPLTFGLPIKLHHWGEPIEAAPQPPTAITEGTTPLPEGTNPPGQAETQPKADDNGDGDVKMEATTPAAEVRSDPKSPLPTTSNDEPTESQSQTENLEETQKTETGTDAEEKREPESDNIIVDSGPPAPKSIASKLPVHSWQYDEFVFSDPFQSFLTILTNNPPTPLPARNRRARNQREDHVQRKKAKSRESVPGPSRGATIEPESGTAGPNTPTPAAIASTSTPAPTSAPAPPEPPIGIPGEPGSADVPLEFSVEMEKGEWNFLNDVRVYLVGEMDRWREKLIGDEKELVKLKDEMGV